MNNPITATYCKNLLKKNLYRKSRFTRATQFKDAYFVTLSDCPTLFMLRNYGGKCVVWSAEKNNEESFGKFYSDRYENIKDFINAVISDIDL